MDYQGTISRGIRAPIIKKGDDLVKITADCVVNASIEHGFPLFDKDVVAVTEAVLARAQGNFATVDQIAKDVSEKFGEETVGLIFPIFSRNRFSMILKGISKGVKKLIVQLTYPTDEVGNSFITPEQLIEKGINPYTDVFTAKEFKDMFGDIRHTFTGVDYIEFYQKRDYGDFDSSLSFTIKYFTPEEGKSLLMELDELERITETNPIEPSDVDYARA